MGNPGALVPRPPRRTLRRESDRIAQRAKGPVIQWSATQKPAMYGNATTSIVLARTRIAEVLRSMITPAEPSSTVLSQVRAMVGQY